LGGRNFEYYSEDPVVAGNIAAAYINGVQSNGVGTSIKHFALNNHEFNRNVMNVIADKRSIREIYLRGFKIAIAASKPWTLKSPMAAIMVEYFENTVEENVLLIQELKQGFGENS
jgi:beta-glucosidase